MASLTDEIAAYEAMRLDLESGHLGEWALVHDKQLIGTYETFDSAAREAVHQFGRGPYLIRQIGAAELTLSASVMYNPMYAINPLRV
jgi:hypothetical protein